MKRLANKWAILNLRTKILILFVLLISLPLGIQSLITFNNFSHSINEQAIGYTSQIIQQMNINLQQTLQDDMQKFSLLALYNKDVLNILDKYARHESQSIIPTAEERAIMFQHIAGYEFSRTYIRGVHIVTNHGFIFTNMDPYHVRSFINYEDEPWVQRVAAANGRWVIIPRHSPNYLLRNNDEDLVAMASHILDPSSAEVIGMIRIDFSDDLFTQLSATYENKEVGSLIIVNRDQEILFQQHPDEMDMPEINHPFLADIPDTDGAIQMKIGDKRYLVTISISQFTGLKIISLNPIASLQERVDPLRHSTIVFGFGCLLVAVILATYISYRLTHPLAQLKHKMMMVREGNIDQSVPVTSHDEIGQLSQAFNKMTEEMNRLVNEVYLISLKEKEAQLSALQSQINPHFIYNTLESINMQAIQAQNIEVSDTVHALGQFLRYTVDKYDRVVTLKDEIEMVKSYVMIQNIRFRSRLQVKFDVDESLNQQRVPKLLLQPLVENAIIHGFDDMQKAGTIWIATHRLDQVLLISVSDDGKGLSEDEVNKLQLQLDSDPPAEPGAKKSIALRNIHQRLQLMFGKNYGIDIDGSPGQGASFTITIPIQEEAAYENHDH